MIFKRRNNIEDKKNADKSNSDDTKKLNRKTDDLLKEINLKVAEAQQDDIDRNLVRIGTPQMNKIGVKLGDFVEIEGNRKTVAKVDRTHPGDLGLNIIRMDDTVRKNAKVSIGENVIIRKAEVYEADVVNLSPLSTFSIPGAENTIGRLLLGRAVSKGDIITIGNEGKNLFFPFFEDSIGSIFNNPAFSFSQLGLSKLHFLVTSTSPKGFVFITEITEIKISNKPANFEDDVYGPMKIPFSLGIDTRQSDIIWLVDNYDSFPIQKSRIIETTKDYQDKIDFDLILYKDRKRYVLKHFNFSVIPASAGKSKIKIDTDVDKYGGVAVSIHNPPSASAINIYSMEEIIKSPFTQAKETIEAINLLMADKGFNLKDDEKGELKKIIARLKAVLKSNDEEKIKIELKKSQEILDKLAEIIYHLD